jgi:hypothetical protein
MFFILVDEATGRAEGMASYLRMVPLHGVIEIGYIWYGLRLQRTTAGTETIYLLLHHAFDNLGYRRVEWKCNALNQASRRAAERFAFTYEGVFRQHMVVRGRNRDTAWYAMLDRSGRPSGERLRRGFPLGILMRKGGNTNRCPRSAILLARGRAIARQHNSQEVCIRELHHRVW